MMTSRLRASLDARRALASVYARMGRLFHDAARVERPCPVCGDRDVEIHPEIRGRVYEFHRCRRCAMLYAPEVVDPHIVARRYRGSELQRDYHKLLEGGGAPTELAGRLAAAAPGRDVAVDVGCGHGGLLVALAERFRDALGLELDPRLAASARRRGVTVAEQRLEDLPRPPGSIDLVTMNQILEHIVEPLPLLAAAHRLLRPGGLLWISVPQRRSLGLTVLRGHHPSVATHMHVNLFDADSLRALAHRAGFRIDELSSDGDPDLGGAGALALASQRAARATLGPLLERLRRGAHLELWARRL